MKDVKEQSYWFKRKKYGYGWTPTGRQGWLIVLLFLVAVLSSAVILLKDTPKNTFSIELFIFLAFTSITIVIAAIISLVKGPKPKWRWGSKPTDNTDEDI